MFVEQILPSARKRLGTIGPGTPIFLAVDLMSNPAKDLLVVCESGRIVGTVSKAEIFIHLSSPWGSALWADVGTIMRRDVVSCGPNDPVAHVWSRMIENDVQCVPVLGDNHKPVGIVHADDVLQYLLKEAQHQDGLLRDYIAGVGYQ